MLHPTNRITHTTAFVIPVVEHWLEREIAQWVHPMKDRSDDPSHHERTLLQRSYISLLVWCVCGCRATCSVVTHVQLFAVCCDSFNHTRRGKCGYRVTCTVVTHVQISGVCYDRFGRTCNYLNLATKTFHTMPP